jgi:hypothetical protein
MKWIILIILTLEVVSASELKLIQARYDGCKSFKPKLIGSSNIESDKQLKDLLGNDDHLIFFMSKLSLFEKAFEQVYTKKERNQFRRKFLNKGLKKLTFIEKNALMLTHIQAEVKKSGITKVNAYLIFHESGKMSYEGFFCSKEVFQKLDKLSKVDLKLKEELYEKFHLDFSLTEPENLKGCTKLGTEKIKMNMLDINDPSIISLETTNRIAMLKGKKEFLERLHANVSYENITRDKSFHISAYLCDRAKK